MPDGTEPSVGDIWRYPFLWSRKAAHGETEGRKLRPVALILLTRNIAGDIEALMVPVTSQPPRDRRFALPVPDIEKQRAGLDVRLSLWVVTDEANVDRPEQSFYFEPGGKLGAFSLHFTKVVQALMIDALKARKLNRTSRR